MFKLPNKKLLMRGVINVLETVADDRKPEDAIAKKFAGTVAKDPDVVFVMRAFKSRFDIGMANANIEPVVEPGTLTIKQWALTIHNEPVIIGTGADDVIEQMTALILSKDPEKLAETKKKISKIIG